MDPAWTDLTVFCGCDMGLYINVLGSCRALLVLLALADITVQCILALVWAVIPVFICLAWTYIAVLWGYGVG